ncbi:MAG: hypothetical protein JNK64_24330 [Myxococcales bacterium]|nr:hypothetical protein [Myxococcales bacterium]
MSMSAPLPLAMLRSGWVVRVGLDEGLLGRARGIAWADHWILALPAPPVELADVSMPGRELPWHAITAIVGEVADADQFAITVALFDGAVADGRCTTEVAVRRLTECMLRDDVASDVQDHLWHLDYNGEAFTPEPLVPAALTAEFRAFAAPYVAAWADAIALVVAA